MALAIKRPALIGGAAFALLAAVVAAFFLVKPAPPPVAPPLKRIAPIPPAHPPAEKPVLAAPKPSTPPPAPHKRQSAPARALITDPIWLRRPSSEIMMDLYPEAALDRDKRGDVLLDCTVIVGGALSCEITKETPPDNGFGRAALQAAKLFRMAPKARDGRATLGRHVYIPFRFEPPRD